MYTVTFYSYRGGVGRTTALVNVAMDLALRGRKVLLVDFDLEAPGLPSFTLLRPNGGTHPGLVEFIDKYRRCGKAPDIADYVYQAKPVGKNCGELWVMPAGRGDDGYWRAFHQINWKQLYDHQDGFVLLEDIKFQCQQSMNPDYVLIDARAGINDRLPICTRQLPDAVVMLFTADTAGEWEDGLLKYADCDQAGFQQVLRDIVEESLQWSPPRIDVLPVASKVPDLDGNELDLINLTVVVLPDDDPNDVYPLSVQLSATIPHAPELLVERQVVAQMLPRKRLPQAYRTLADALIRSNCCQDREGAQTFLEELRQHPEWAVAVPANHPTERWFERSGRLDQLLKYFDEDAEILAQAASCLFKAGRYDEAMYKLDQAIELAPAGDRYLWYESGPRSGKSLVIVALADSILWQRASFRKILNLPSEVDDLLRILDSSAPSLLRHLDMWFDFGKGTWDLESTKSKTTRLRTEAPPPSGFCGIDPYVASAFQQLRQLAPAKVQEALQMPRIQQLPSELRQSLIAGAPDIPPPDPQKPHSLIGAGKWRDAITLLEARVAESSPAKCLDLFSLAMAYWGAGEASGEARATELCRSARESMINGNQVESILQDYDSNHIEQFPALALMFWKAGDGPTARRFLDRCDELLPEARDSDSFFSAWRFQHVKRTQFQADCHCQRQMIQGHIIRPYFLGKKPGAP